MPPPPWRRYARLLRPDPAADVDEELAFHLEMRRRDYEARGHAPDEARRLAHARFGDVDTVAAWLHAHDLRRARGEHRRERMHAAWTDLRLAARTLRRRPGFAALAVLTLALGLGATTAVFGVVSAVLLRPLPFDGADRIVLLGEAPATRDPGERRIMSTSWPNFSDWQRAARRFDAMAAFNGWEPALTGVGEPEVLRGALVTAGVFDVFRVVPALGRPLVPADNATGSEPVVVLAHGFWTRRFGGDPGVVGRRLVLNGVPRTVVGVLPRGFRPPGDLGGDVWANNTFDSTDVRSARYLQAAGRIAPSATPEGARAELRTISRRLAAAYPADNAGLEAVATPLRERVAGDARRPLLLLLGASACVLLVACANVANLLIARGLARGHEFAVRAALGAGRGRVLRHVLAESLMLALLGAGLGALLAAAATRAVLRLAPEALRAQPVLPDWRVLGFGAAATVATALLAGLLPAWRAARVRPAVTLRAGGRTVTRGAGLRARDLLAVGQLALALALLTGAGLLGKSLVRLARVEPGLPTAGLAAVSVNLPAARYPRGREAAFFDAVLARLRARGDVRGAAAASTVPFSGSTDMISVDVAGWPPRPGADALAADRFIVTPSYLATAEVPLRAGRALAETDRAGGPLVAVIDEVFARRLAEAGPLPGGSPLGLRLSYGDTAWATVVGVVGHVRHHGAETASGGQIYLSSAQVPWRWMSVIVRAAHPEGAAALVPAVRAAVRAVDPDQPVFDETTVDALLRERTAGRRFLLTVVAAFTGVALALAAVGLYGVMAYAVAQRRRDFGVRLALGAAPARLRRAVLGRGMALASAGVAAGTALSLAASRLLGGLLYDVRPGDPAVLAGVAAVLLAVAAAAAWWPARRAAAVPPHELLRGE